jgi:hypothetical protein
MKLITENITRVILDNGTEFLRTDNGKLWIELDLDVEDGYTYVYEVRDTSHLEDKYRQALKDNLENL